MKYVKMLGLASTLALVLVVFVKVSAGPATVLCANNSNTTTCSAPIGQGAELSTTSVSKVKLETTFKNIECESSSMKSKIENPGSSSSTVKALVEGLTFEGCNCSLVVLQNGSFEVHHIAGTDNGTVTASGTEITSSCSTIFGTVHCIYITENAHFGTLVGSGSQAKLKAEKLTIARKSTNAICDEQALLTAEYVGPSEKPLFVSEG